MWADRITVRKRLGCSPYFALTGTHPVLPFDIMQATWLMQIPRHILSTTELIGLRARALALHTDRVKDIMETINEKKRKERKKIKNIKHNQQEFYGYFFNFYKLNKNNIKNFKLKNFTVIFFTKTDYLIF